MDASQAMRAMVERAGLTHAQIETRAGRYGGWVGQTLARPRPGADLLATLAHVCGYRLELVPVTGGESIPIGDTSSDSSVSSAPEHDAIEQTRALLARALQTLDSVASMSVASSSDMTDSSAV